jgi:hypothetical protein
MGTFADSIEIARPPRDVWRFVIEEGIGDNQAPRLFEGVEGPLAFEVLPPGRIELGARVRERVRTLNGKEESVVLEVVELEEGAVYRARLLEKGAGLSRLDEAFRFEHVDGGTRFTAHFDYRIQGLLAPLLDRLVRRWLGRIWGVAMGRIKAEVESRPLVGSARPSDA